MPARAKRKAKGSYHHGDLERGLVQAALQIIRDEGVHALTLRGVGSELGVSRTALYRHFEDKAALLARVARDGFRMLHDVLVTAARTAAEAGGNPLEAMASAYVQFALSNRSHYQTMFGGAIENWGAYPDLREQAQAAFDVLAGGIREAQQRGRVVAGDPVEIAQVMWALVHGMATLAIAGQLKQRGKEIEELVSFGARLVRDGLRPR